VCRPTVKRDIDEMIKKGHETRKFLSLSNVKVNLPDTKAPRKRLHVYFLI
jgi:hypothetical protein